MSDHRNALLFVQPAIDSPGTLPQPTISIARIDRRADNCIAARQKVIDLWKRTHPFGQISWSSNCWDVTDALRRTMKGYVPRRRALINFTKHRGSGQRLGAPFPEDNDLADLIKAFVCRRHAHGPVTALRHMVYVRAWRYLVAVMSRIDPAELTPSVFNKAALAATARETSTTAYSIHVLLENIADTLDELHIVKLRLNWAWAKKSRPPGFGGPKQKKLTDKSKEDRRASDEVVFAVAQLYRVVPQSEWADRLCVLLATILVCTGLRLGQVLCLRAEMPHFDADTGEHYILLVPFKRAEATRKPLLPSTVDLLKDVFSELLQMTSTCREVAQWLEKHPEKVHLPYADGPDRILTATQIRVWFGLSESQYCYRRKRWNIEGEAVLLSTLNERLRKNRFDGPAVPGNGHDELKLSDCLSISFLGAMKRGGTPMRHVVHPVSGQHVSDRIRGRQSKGKIRNPNIFQRYSLVDEDGNPWSARSHSFRHKLNDALDKGGVPDLIQAQWFGRANPRDNEAYQYPDMAEMREKARQLILDGKLHGSSASLLQQVVPECRNDAAKAMVQDAHPTAGGYCLQSFAQIQCVESGQCLEDCQSYHWASGEWERKDELEEIQANVSRKLEVVLGGMTEVEARNDQFFLRQLDKLKAVSKILQSLENGTNDK